MKGSLPCRCGSITDGDRPSRFQLSAGDTEITADVPRPWNGITGDTGNRVMVTGMRWQVERTVWRSNGKLRRYQSATGAGLRPRLLIAAVVARSSFDRRAAAR